MFVTSVGLRIQPNVLQRLILEKIQLVSIWKNTCHINAIYGKMPVIEVSYNFLYVWNCMVKCFSYIEFA